MKNYSVGGTEITEDADVIEVTATATLACIFDRLQNKDGTPFTDEEMKDVGEDYIRGEYFRMSDMNNIVYTVNGPGKLDNLVAAKLLKQYLLNVWQEDLAHAKRAEAGGSVIVAIQEIADIEPLETYEEVRNAFIQFVHNWEPRREDLANDLLTLLVER